jgi:hypothetical protein
MINALRIEPNLFPFELLAEAISPRRNQAAFNPCNECSKCPWNHINSLTCDDVVQIKMPLHYHNRIVKDHTANSLLELAKH